MEKPMVEKSAIELLKVLNVRIKHITIRYLTNPNS